MPENFNGCKEAVCVDAGRVYDSCADKDCAEDMEVYFTECDQALINSAVSVRARTAEVLTTCIDVEALPFNRGYYSCDLTFYFRVALEVFSGCCAAPANVNGLATFSKKVILYGGEGGVKIFGSEYREDKSDIQELPKRNVPKCSVQIAEPVILGSQLVNANSCRCRCSCGNLPECVQHYFGAAFAKPDCCNNVVLVTLGVFTIVQLIRNVQMLMPVYDFCMPSKECSPNTESACDLFRKMTFPVDEFFPPKTDCGCGCDCGCNNN